MGAGPWVGSVLPVHPICSDTLLNPEMQVWTPQASVRGVKVHCKQTYKREQANENVNLPSLSSGKLALKKKHESLEVKINLSLVFKIIQTLKAFSFSTCIPHPYKYG